MNLCTRDLDSGGGSGILCRSGSTVAGETIVVVLLVHKAVVGGHGIVVTGVKTETSGRNIAVTEQ